MQATYVVYGIFLQAISGISKSEVVTPNPKFFSQPFSISFDLITGRTSYSSETYFTGNVTLSYIENR